MKSLLTLFALFLGLGIANAQEKKPNLEETVKYINDIISASIGENYKREKYKSYIRNQTFSLNEIIIEEQTILKDDNELLSSTKSVYTNISWSTLNKIEIGKDDDDNFQIIGLYFSTPLNFSETNKTRFKNEEKNTGQSWLMFYVVKNKKENVKKALLHLKELTYKKDPFE